MIDDSKKAPADSPTPPARRTRASEPPDPPIRRHVYLSTRLREIAAEADEIAEYRSQLFADLQTELPLRVPNREEVRQRRAYLAERLAAIATERAELDAEKEALERAGD